jgi:hypothetical protein
MTPFLCNYSSICGLNDAVMLPRNGNKCDWEVDGRPQ